VLGQADERKPGTTHPVVLALWSARVYDIWGGPVIVQTLLSNQQETIVLLIPDRPKGALGKTSKEWQKDWQIEATFPHKEPTRPRVTTRGALQKLPEGTPNRKMGQVVALAADFLAQYHHLDRNIPGSFDTVRVGQAYRLILQELPSKPDAGVIVEMSLDLSQIHFVP
jgi:hypothetical protein